MSGQLIVEESLITLDPVLVSLVSIAGFSERTVSAGAAELTAATPGQLQVMITSSELVVGHNRFAFGLLKDDKVLNAASVAVRLYELRSQEARLTAETPAHYHKLEVVEQGKHIHIHPDGTRHAHGGGTDVHGIYVAAVTFQRPGPWGLEILARQGDVPVEAARLTITADEMPRSPAGGANGARSGKRIASDGTRLLKIDS